MKRLCCCSTNYNGLPLLPQVLWLELIICIGFLLTNAYEEDDIHIYIHGHRQLLNLLLAKEWTTIPIHLMQVSKANRCMYLLASSSSQAAALLLVSGGQFFECRRWPWLLAFKLLQDGLLQWWRGCMCIHVYNICPCWLIKGQLPICACTSIFIASVDWLAV